MPFSTPARARGLSQQGSAGKISFPLLGISACLFIAGAVAFIVAGSAGKSPAPQNRPVPKVEDIRPEAEQGDARAQEQLGEIYAKGLGVTQSYKDAAKWYRLAAKQGNAAAQTALGELYETGQGVPHDETEAAKWYQRAAQQGYERAQYILATLYTVGTGVPLNAAEAIKWYRRAANQGDALAQFNLGMRYLEGNGLSANPVEAWKWLSLAEAGGIADARDAKRSLSSRITSEQLRQARREVEAFQKQTSAPHN